MTDASGSGPFKVAYILHRFPHLTETFIVREMYWLRQCNVDLTIFSLMTPKSSVVSAQAAHLVPLTTYSPMFSWGIVRSQAPYLRRRPVRYVRALLRIVWQTYREPKVMGLALSLFPKSVHFARQIEESGIRHVHANFVWLEGLAAGVVRDLAGVSFTIEPHAFGLFSRNQRNVRRELENATRIVTISEHHRQYIANLSPAIAAKDVDIVHCGIEPDRIAEAAPRQRNQPPRIVSVGRAIEKKGHEYLIQACAELHRRGVAYTCELVVGRGGRREQLQRLIDDLGISSTVSLLDARDEEGIFELLETADIFALACVIAASGDRDGIPVSLMEAMANGLPVVSTPIAGIPELVEDGVTGLLVASRNSGELADALARLIADADLAAQIGERGRQKIAAEFRVDENAARMAEIFRAVGAGNAR